MTDQIAFIGDIHGALDPLTALVERAREEADDLVFLGDFVNRGLQSRQVLDYLVELQRELGPRTHYLSGHHDQAFLDAIDEGRIDRFLRMGGAATLSSYPQRSLDGTPLSLRQRVPATHIEFLRSLETSFTGPGCFAAHDQKAAEAPPTGRFGVFGHLLLASGVPEINDARALIDTGCGTLPDGKLTCFLWPSKTWFQTP